MASGKPSPFRKFQTFFLGFFNTTWTCLWLISCSYPEKPPLDNSIPLPPVNPGDRMAISKIAQIRKDGFREISATGPEAMRYIFYKAGCKDGSPLLGLLSHEWKEGSRLERWTGACKSRKTDSIYFTTFSESKSERLREFGSTTIGYLKLAETEKDPRYFFLAIEHEPALADARLGLFRHEIYNRNCEDARRHMEIFLILSPGFHAISDLKKVWSRHCTE